MKNRKKKTGIEKCKGQNAKCKGQKIRKQKTGK
jgi:hypothetical protein